MERDEPLPRGSEARSDRGIHAAIPELPAPELALPEPAPEPAAQPAAVQPLVAVPPPDPAPAPVLPLRGLPPLPEKGVAVLGSGSLSLRVRRVQTAARVAAEPTDWRGILGASVAALLLIAGMKVLAESVPASKVSGDPEVIRPRPLVVRASPKKPDPLALPQQASKAQGRKDPGKAVVRHSGQEGEAGSKSAPRREARAERARDERAIVANTGLLKALGMGKGASDVFGVALEKGTRDAMGHLTGPRSEEHTSELQ